MKNIVLDHSQESFARGMGITEEQENALIERFQKEFSALLDAPGDNFTTAQAIECALKAAETEEERLVLMFGLRKFLQM